MAANQPVMKIKKGDTVSIRLGADKGKTGKVLAVHPKQQAVTIEGIGVRKRHIRPSQANPRGGTKDIHIPTPVSKVALVADDKGTTSRVGYILGKDGKKVRVAKQLKNKEIK
jgi:large subunit ribosomal protein L24